MQFIEASRWLSVFARETIARRGGGYDVEQCLAGLEAAISWLIHRDIKPGNILLERASDGLCSSISAWSVTSTSTPG